jgi:hypothetical protein
MKYDSRHDRTEPLDPPRRILFHINDFGKGGTETSLLAWLKTLDRQLFAPSVCVTYPTDELLFWRAHSIPDDVPVHVLAPSKWMNTLHETRRQGKLGGHLKLLHKVLTYGVIRPLAALRFRQIVRDQDIVCDFDFSLRHLAGTCNVPWIGVSHFSLAARLGEKSARYLARRVKQYSRYAAIAVLTPDMLREGQALFPADRVNLVELPNVIDVESLRRKARAAIERPAPKGSQDPAARICPGARATSEHGRPRADRRRARPGGARATGRRTRDSPVCPFPRFLLESVSFHSSGGNAGAQQPLRRLRHGARRGDGARHAGDFDRLPNGAA